MFERYTEKARRSIFWARHEASASASPTIESVHLLLGLLQDNSSLLDDTVDHAKFVEEIRLEIARGGHERVATSTSVDLPLSHEAKRVLAYGAEEAQRLSHRYIGTEHLLLGMLREEGSLPARLLRAKGLDLEIVRNRVSGSAPVPEPETPTDGGRVDRNALHALINTLPEDAFVAAAMVLKRMQKWRPDMPLEILEGQRQRMGGGGITGTFRVDPGQISVGSRMEDGAQVRESHIVFHGHQITLQERLQISDDSKRLKYSQHLLGPKREHQIEIDFDLT